MNRIGFIRILGLSLVAVSLAADGGELKLRNVYSDGMLFQRDQPIVFAGTGDAGGTVTVKMNGASAEAKVGADGAWRAELKPMEAGGPYEAVVTDGKGTLNLRDILVGELWLASGQSNMEMPIWGTHRYFRLTNGQEVAAAAHDSGIRFLKVERKLDYFGKRSELPGAPKWRRADDPEAVKPLSATAYWFACDLRRRLKVPVGIIDSSWGGTYIESWIEESRLRKLGVPKDLELLEFARDPRRDNCPKFLFEMQKPDLDKVAKWMAAVEDANAATTAVAKANWMKPDLAETGWKPSATKIEQPGIVWFRWQVEVPAGAEDVRFEAKNVGDTDEAWFDGRKVGATEVYDPYYWKVRRRYPVGKVAAGRHVLAMRVFCHCGYGGVSGARLAWKGGSVDLDAQRPLARVEATPPKELGKRPGYPWEQGHWRWATLLHGSNIVPSSLHNAMIAPLDVFRCRGTIWYQGCSNEEDWMHYHDYQKALVEGLRDTFARDDMAFVCVQLAGMAKNTPVRRLKAAEVAAMPPSEGGFVKIRDAQARIREVPLCDCATAFDIGDHSDIHPRNKKDVGKRLAGLAAVLCYGSTEKARGPEVVKSERKGAAFEITFSEPLVLRNGRIGEHEFTFVDATGRVAWAKGELVGPKTVRVTCDEIGDPAHVDYCRVPFVFAASLFNADGYPALPFSIDCVTHVLMIGNSFSICCLKHLPRVAADRGVKLDLASLYIGGCPLSLHWANALSNEVDRSYRPYQFDRNTMGERTKDRMNVLDALRMEKWDFVTVQQASHESWRPESYHPYGDKLVAKIRELAPQAKVYVQETWSYIPWDGRYKEWGIDQDEMYAKLHAAYADFAAKLNLPVIPFGTKVQEWRRRLPVKYTENSLGGDVVGGIGWKPEHWFKRDAAGKWVCRCDPCHLGERGEYFQALVWAKSLLGVSVRDCGYKPDFVTDSDAKLMREIAEE